METKRTVSITFLWTNTEGRSLSLQVGLIILSTTLPFTSCTNSFLNHSPTVLPSSSPSPANLSVDKVAISSAQVSTPTQNSASPIPVTTIYFDSSKSTAPISNHCNLSSNSSGNQTGKPCNCQFTWTELNSTQGVNPITGLPGSPISHVVVTPLSNVQPYLVNCEVPQIYSTEVLNGTQITLTVVPGTNNPDNGLFQVPNFQFTKGSSQASGSFTDSQGHAFQNIMHYSCYGMFQRGTEIQSKRVTATLTAATASVDSGPIMLGSQFCVASLNGNSVDPTGCPNLGPPDYSSQNFYYNLYTGASSTGSINAFNSSFVCPMVKEALSNAGTVAGQNKFWPLDSTFALSMGPTADFSVGIVANTQVALSGDPASNNTTCQAIQGGLTTNTLQSNPSSGNTSSSANAGGLVHSCLGYAALANADGTCPSFKDVTGQLRPTFRLRKYVAIYPRIFDTTGYPLASPQPIDTIFVLDRPVKGPTNSNPLQPYTMLGPKPCPFAYFDKKGVVSGSTPAYIASNDSGWAGKNVDGIEFPNQDVAGQSCAASFPVLNTRGQFSIKTIAPGSHVYVRPTQPFLPHYEEDTSFQACAPQASPFKDAPLHFVRLTSPTDPANGNVAWCAEYYPTQNDNLLYLDPPSSTTNISTGNIAPFTSHTQKASASQACTATLVNTSGMTFPACGGAVKCWGQHLSSQTLSTLTGDNANASATCDRTVVNNSSTPTVPGTQWPRFPLLAPPKNIEDQTYGIATDKSYHCLVTFDNNSGKALKTTPTDGCCSSSSVQVSTGVGTSTASSAHLEPDAPCKPPSY